MWGRVYTGIVSLVFCHAVLGVFGGRGEERGGRRFDWPARRPLTGDKGGQAWIVAPKLQRG